MSILLPTPFDQRPTLLLLSLYAYIYQQMDHTALYGGDTVELVNVADRQAGGGAFYDEEGCANQARGTSVVGCDFGG